jgi:hypothetical protein
MNIMKQILKIATVSLSVLLSLSSCDKEKLADLNIDQNSVSDMDQTYLFSLATLRIAGEYENTRANMLYAATMIQHTSSTAGYFSGDKYFYNAQYSGAYMERHYTDVIKLFSNAISKTKDDASMANVWAASTLLRAFDLHRMTDLYGDIPYEQAGRGFESEENWFPKYDNQKDIYGFLVRDIKAARDKFSASAKSLGSQDFVYGGDITKWKKFANSLLMRVALRMSNVDAANARTIFLEAYNNGAFTSNADNANIKFAEGPQGINRNGLNDGYWNTYKYSKDCKVSRTFVNWMKANNDPRLMIVTGGTGNPEASATWNTTPANQNGMPNGYTTANMPTVLTPTELAAWNSTSTPRWIFSMLNIKYMDWSDPYMMQTYAEVELMAAEAAVLGWLTTNSATHFQKGVDAAIKNWSAFDASFARSQADIDAYITGRGFAAASTNDKRRLIGEEYWAATFLNDIESWSNWRRTGIPALTPTNDPNRWEVNQIPRRLKYWENEISSNPTNYKAAVDRMGGDNFMTKVWWDGGK